MHAILRYGLSGLTVSVCGILVFFPIADTDLWWHLAAGREIIARQWFLFSDPFSITAYGRPWIDLHWFFQVCMFLAVRAGGLSAIVWAKCLVFGLAWIILLSSVRKRSTLVASCFLAILSTFAVRFLILERPLVFTLVYLSLFLFLFGRYQQTGKTRYLWMLAPVQILWVNTQGLFLLGPAVLACFLFGGLLQKSLSQLPLRFVQFEHLASGALRYYALAFIGLIACSLLNPYGLRAFDLAFLVLQRILPGFENPYAYNISENLPFWAFAESSFAGSLWIRIFGLAVLLTFVVGRKSLSIGRFLLFISFLTLSLMAERNLPLYVVVLTFLLAANLDASVFVGDAVKRIGRGGRLITGTFVVAFAAVCVVSIGKSLSARVSDPRAFVAPFRHPIGATEFLKRTNLQSNVFHSDRYGGYLSWKLHPRALNFLDGRFVLRSSAFFVRFLGLLDHPETFPQWVAQYRIGWVLLPLSDGPYGALTSMLAADPAWRAVYADGSDIVFTNEEDHWKWALDFGSKETIGVIRHRVEEEYGENAFLKNRAIGNLDRFLERLQTAHPRR